MKTQNTDQDSNVSRTPVAWRHRDLHLSSRPSSVYQSNAQLTHNNPNHPRTSSPSLTTTSSDDREEVPMVRQSRRQNGSLYSQTLERRNKLIPRHFLPRNSIVNYGPVPRGYRTATLRSTRSFPGLMMSSTPTWDGEPCPVHGSGHNAAFESTPSIITTRSNYVTPMNTVIPIGPQMVQPIGPIIGPPMGPPISQPMNGIVPLSPTSISPSNPSLGNVSNIGLMTMKRFNSSAEIRKIPVIYGEVGKTIYEGKSSNNLPVAAYVGSIARNSLPILMGTPMMIESNKMESVHQLAPIYQRASCCKGHLIVLWITLGVVTIGVISAIILGVTIQ